MRMFSDVPLCNTQQLEVMFFQPGKAVEKEKSKDSDVR